ncbi:MAG: glycosyltransferase [Actinobacteria bacterium]|nr:glycosyltransferase [Actinomycetota bacterium]
MKPKRASSAFIIACRNRPDELVVAVESLVRQTVLPAELCIVDSSDETPTRAKIEELCDAAGVPLDYHHPAPRGLTIQRNIGIDRTTGDPVFFIDDDVFLEPDCHERILEEYERWDGARGVKLGGIRATPKHPARPPLVSIMWRKLFGIGGWWPEASGKMRRGFWVEGISIAKGVRKIEYMTGWFMSFKREVFEKERFDENLAGYAHKEDVDLTYRVHKHGYVMLQTPAAICDHFQTSTSRLTSHQLTHMNLRNQFYLHRKNMPQDARHRLALWWGLIGQFLLNVARAAARNDWGLVTGMIAGALEQTRARGTLDLAQGGRA